MYFFNQKDSEVKLGQTEKICRIRKISPAHIWRITFPSYHRRCLWQPCYRIIFLPLVETGRLCLQKIRSWQNVGMTEEAALERGRWGEMEYENEGLLGLEWSCPKVCHDSFRPSAPSCSQLIKTHAQTAHWSSPLSSHVMRGPESCYSRCVFITQWMVILSITANSLCDNILFSIILNIPVTVLVSPFELVLWGYTTVSRWMSFLVNRHVSNSLLR